MGYYSIVLRIVSVDFHRLVKPIDINRLIFCRFYCLYYWFRWLIFIDWACQGLTKATVLVRTTPWFVINIMFGVSSSGKQGNIPRNIWAHCFCPFGLNSEAGVEKQFFSDNFIIWQVSVTTRNAIGCGIYQDKFFHLARLSNFAQFFGHKAEKPVSMFNSLTQDEVF